MFKQRRPCFRAAVGKLSLWVASPGSESSLPFFNAEVTLFQRGIAKFQAVTYDTVSQESQHGRYRFDRGVAHRLCLDHVADEKDANAGTKRVLQLGVQLD